MDQLFIFSSAEKRALEIEEWLQTQTPGLRLLAEQWVNVLRDCGDDVDELIHDGYPVLCVTQTAFAYVAAFKAHVNVGFYRGAELDDPAGLLEGNGRFMRHVKLRPEATVDEDALRALIASAYSDMQRRIEA